MSDAAFIDEPKVVESRIKRLEDRISRIRKIAEEASTSIASGCLSFEDCQTLFDQIFDLTSE